MHHLLVAPDEELAPPHTCMHTKRLTLLATSPHLPKVRDIELSNPSRKLVSYAARLEGHNDFGLEATSIKAEPGRTARLSVRCVLPLASHSFPHRMPPTQYLTCEHLTSGRHGCLK